jgi:hypothetical protein
LDPAAETGTAVTNTITKARTIEILIDTRRDVVMLDTSASWLRRNAAILVRT